MSTISNERLEEIAEEDFGSDVLFESSVLARELLALRKEREKADKLVRDTTALAEKLSAETDTTAQQFESLEGKAVGGWIPCSERMPKLVRRF
ncbi:hypothetical protein R2233_000790 [Cronobacter turicensis]|nr:hypothetical protein [Cronobacter turicensis]